MKNKYIGDLVLSTQQIELGVEMVAKSLNEDFSADNVVGISVVPGGIIFTADLVRKLEFDIEMDYLACLHSPGDRNNSSPIDYQQNVAIEGKAVVLIDDAIESGGTMKRLVDFLLKNFNPLSVSTATLFVKPGRVEIPVKQYFAYEVESDDLMVGYGLPWRNKYRNLPFIAKVAL